MRKNNKLVSGVRQVVLAASSVYVFNKAVFFLSTAGKKLYEEKRHTFEWRFGRISYTKRGNGSPVLLIHELSSEGTDCEWHEMLKHLTKGHTIYTLDLPGCGRSVKSRCTYTNYFYVKAVNDFIRQVIGEKTDVITSGCSSSIAVMAGCESPDLFGKMILIQPEHSEYMSKSPEMMERVMKKIIEVPIFGTLLYNMAFSRLSIALRFIGKYYSHPMSVRLKDINRCHEAAHIGGSASRYLFASQLSGFTKINCMRVLKQLKAPVMVITGDLAVMPEDILSDYSERGKEIYGVRMEDVKGRPHMEKPKQTAEFCGRFLEKQHIPGKQYQ